MFQVMFCIELFQVMSWFFQVIIKLLAEKMSMRGSSRGSLPTISNPQLTYSQRYEHMTKLANYSELNQVQIWKEYQKLRACLKELNEEVLHHMEKKAYGSIGKTQKQIFAKDQEGTMVLLEDEKKVNDTRLSTYTNELSRHEQRIKYLQSLPNLLDQLNTESDQLNQRIRQVRKDNRDLNRNAQMQGRDLVNNTSMLDKLMIEQQKLTRVFKQHKKYYEHMKVLTSKNERFQEKISELQKAIDLRVEQFSRTENYIAEEIHFDHYEELKKQKEAVGKYEPIYKRNYLMKLKELQNLVNNIAKQDKIISENEANILNVRQEIEAISQLVTTQRKRYHSTTMNKKQGRMSSTRRNVADSTGGLEQESVIQPYENPNDKNREGSRGE